MRASLRQQLEARLEPTWAARRSRLKRAIGRCVDSRAWNLVSVAFTIYALFGDDFRLACTDKPADNGFNVAVLICLCFFSAEICLKCSAQSDYFPGFFFVLDVVATASLVLDLTWVSETLIQDVSNQSNRARSGRTARVAASLGRVVRVLRLVRVFKLYKAFYEKRKMRDTGARAPGTEGGMRGMHGSERHMVADNWDSDGWEEDAHAEENGANDSESLVGKKLVALTTRKVILLVLVMLMAMPFLTVPTSDMFGSSSSWGADSVWQAFRLLGAGNLTREAYEEAVLKFIYYHSWFEGHGSCSRGADSCANEFYGHTFWVGLASTKTETLRRIASEASLQADTVVRWEQMLQQRRTLYSLGTFPAEARETLSQPWGQVCVHAGLPHLGLSLLSREIRGFVDHTVRCPSDLRVQERFRETPLLLDETQYDDWHFAFFFDMRPMVKQESSLGIITTVFICLVLSVASVLFSADADNLVLAPIERMITKVNKIRDDPLQAMKMADAVFQTEEAVKHRRQKRSSRLIEGAEGNLIAQARRRLRVLLSRFSSQEEEGVAETAILEKTIIKLGSLLALGFGHAGVNIVSLNMSALDSAGVNAMIPGVCVDCLIGYAKIRHFSTATEVLQTKIMTFVNQIAEIVHGLVTEYHGAANKNNGDTFLIIWRAEDYTDDYRSRMAEMSLVAFARILGQVHMSHVLARYRGHPGLQQRLGSGCRVDMGFGLHLGWAIEGAVGSDFKIDASYLSPNVSIAEGLERATHVYGVHLIASDSVVQSCSQAVAGCCRLIDKAMIGGSKAPIGIYTFDLDPMGLEVEEWEELQWNVRQRFRARQLLEVEKQRKWGRYNLLDEAAEVGLMRQRYTIDFFQTFNMGFQNYSQGEWQAARRYLLRARIMLGVEDGPSAAILAFMERPHQFEAPEGWRGVREMQGPSNDGG